MSHSNRIDGLMDASGSAERRTFERAQRVIAALPCSGRSRKRLDQPGSSAAPACADAGGRPTIGVVMSQGEDAPWLVRRADVVTHTEEESGLAYLSVSLRDDALGSCRFIEFQLALDPDERMGGYCILDSAPVGSGDPLHDIAVQVSHRSLYGGVRRCEAAGTTIVLSFEPEAQQVFGWSGRETFLLEMGNEKRKELLKAMQLVFSSAPPGESVELVGFEGDSADR